MILDLDCAQPLGYNHDSHVFARDSLVYDRFLQGARDLTNCPPSDFSDLLREQVMPVAPRGTSSVFLADGGYTQANEVAISTALMAYSQKHGKDLTQLQVLGFENGSHGQSVATLSCSDRAVNKHNLPTYNWPIAPFPKMQYPMAQFEHENRDEEEFCLQETRRLIEAAKARNQDVAAMIIEPISARNNVQATPLFYKRLRAMAKELGIAFIVDETRTGFGQSAKMWAHEHWYLQDYDGGAPDIVSFGGKAGVSGVFSSKEYRVSPTCSAFTQVVDVVKLINFGIVWQEIQRK